MIRWALNAAVGIALATSAFAAPVRGEHEPAWLDDSHGKRALAWVAHEQERTLNLLQADPRFATFEAEATSILTDPSRIETPTFTADAVYEYRQDRDRPLGVWRRSPRAAYLSGKPIWETLIDLDALAAAEHKKFIFAGASCRKRRCLVRLSVNGKDANETREFDLDTKQFVRNGFFVPDGKSRTWWYDDDTLLIAPTLGRDSVTFSMVPKTLRLWRRGTPVAAAKTLFAIGDHDAMLSVSFINAAGTDRFIVARHVDFERREYRLMSPDGTSRQLALPELAQIMGVYRGKLLLRPDVPWTPDGSTTRFPAGALVGISLDALMKDARIAEPELIYQPPGDDALRGTTVVGDRLLVELLHDYFSRVVELKSVDGGWSARTLPLPSERFLTLLDSDAGKLVLREEAPLVPDRIVLADLETGVEQPLYVRAPAFDASDLETELYHTASRDGTPIDYLVSHPRGMKLDGRNPTLVYAYGGYDVPVTPRYEPIFGKLWMERGGVYVHAYLRGGGEHGPAWHRDAMREHRQQPFDDMEAVLRDLSRRGIASPQHLGIMGRSNGGLMVATVMEQTPELMNAVVVGGPLIDMLNFQHLPPGGTWLAEYGDPDVPGDAAFLRTYSPMQNIAGPEKKYPVPLIITATDDDRVLPGHARRFAWQLAAHGHDRLYFEDNQGGHYWELGGGPIPGDYRLRAVARAAEFTYLWQRLGGREQAQ